MKKIKWEKVKKYNITYWYGKVDGLLFFEIYQFKNDVFEDPFVMTSDRIPSRMKHDVSLEKLQDNAERTFEYFLNRIK